MPEPEATAITGSITSSLVLAADDPAALAQFYGALLGVELQHEAREALIAHMGPAHATVRVRVRRGPRAPVSGIRPVGRPAAFCR